MAEASAAQLYSYTDRSAKLLAQAAISPACTNAFPTQIGMNGTCQSVRFVQSAAHEEAQRSVDDDAHSGDEHDKVPTSAAAYGFAAQDNLHQPDDPLLIWEQVLETIPVMRKAGHQITLPYSARCFSSLDQSSNEVSPLINAAFDTVRLDSLEALTKLLLDSSQAE